MSTDRLDPERWQRAVALFERLLTLPPEARDRALAGEDPALRLTVLRMLERDETADTLLDEGVESFAEITLEGRRPEPEFETGDRVGDFEILGVLGRGGMGVVYEARDLKLGRIAALKFLPTTRRATGGDAERLFSEARAASALDHPNIATVYQVGETDGRPFIAMARYEGRTLRERLREDPLDPREALEIAIQVARALSVAHEAGIVHRDVKPGNIFLTGSGLVKLLDFGIAATGGTVDELHGHGTVRYMSPEQARREPPDARSDVWSLGVVLHEMLTGEPMQRVFASREAGEAGAGRDGADSSSRVPDLPGWIRTVAARCVAPRVAQRYRDGGELLEALERCRPARRHGRTRRVALLAAAATMIVLALRGPFAVGASDRPPLIAVGEVEDREALAGAAGIDIAGFLTASLARVPDLPLVSDARMEQLRAQLVSAGESAPDRRELAALAGAQVALEARLGRGSDGELRLDLARVDLTDGSRRRLDAVRGDHVATLLQEGARAVAREFGLREPPLLSPLSSPSAVARRFYEEGLRAYYEGDRVSALRLFSSALDEDSSFAMAAYYQWRSHWVDRVGRIGASDSVLLVALRKARDLPERERLLIRANWASMWWDPTARVLAESLAVRHPQELDGHLLLGSLDVRGARPLRAIPHLRRVIEMDSLSLRGVTPQCRACDAFPWLADAYRDVDSLDSAERTIREWLEWRPESADAWSKLAEFLEGVGRYDEALSARREEARFGPGRVMAGLFPARAELFAGRWPEADRMLAERMRHGSPLLAREARWLLTISLREQGRLEAALEAERARVGRASEGARAPAGGGTIFEGQLLTELGRWDEAARIFSSLSDRGRRVSRPGFAIKETVWPMAHLATALAAAGDTAALAIVSDSLQVIGRRDLRARDRRLHHYARGLLFLRRGDLRGAERELRAARGPVTDKLSRVNLELGRTLIALGKPREAIPVLQAALVGDLEGGHLYVSRTELHEALGRAYEAAGDVDLAVAHYGWVAEAWKRADPILHSRRDSALARLAALTER